MASETEQKDTTESGRTGAEPENSTRFSAEEIHSNVLEAAKEEMDRPVSELAISGFAAGLAMGFSFLSATFVTSLMAPEHRVLATAIGYPLGFIYVVMASHQLFTENTLEPVIPLLEERNAATAWKLLRLWGIVLPVNLIGTAIFSFCVAHTRLLDPSLSQHAMDVAREATTGDALSIFYKAIWAGWLVALMAWILASARETIAQVVLIWLTTAPIAAFGFKHSIAGAVEAFYRVWMGDASLTSMMTSFELPALAGNIVGGVVLVAMVNHGQAGGKSNGKSNGKATGNSSGKSEAESGR